MISFLWAVLLLWYLITDDTLDAVVKRPYKWVVMVVPRIRAEGLTRSSPGLVRASNLSRSRGVGARHGLSCTEQLS